MIVCVCESAVLGFGVGGSMGLSASLGKEGRGGGCMGKATAKVTMVGWGNKM